ncbi:olfactory receptor 5J3-like [Erythrolamprus reginae]|uniref:olfactory receptor 5J3-like n=1 Tax=Erythrolamprus reginae TaxID=121349 RepID=UPI00396C772C
MANRTQVTEFILTGLTDDPQLQLILLVIFFILYAITLLGNVGMIVLIWISPQLHTPMYFFLSHVSFVDICCSSTITPNFLCHLVKDKKVISLAGCFTQLYFYAVFSTAESYILAIMAYDRYVAVCHPLVYLITMPQIKCVQLVVISYITGVVHGLLHIIPASQLFFCGPNIIKNFFCEGPALLQLACSDISLNNLLKFIFIGFTIITTMVIVLTSYISILITILNMTSTKSRRKAFSTCTSHLTVITVFYGCAGLVYTQSQPTKSIYATQMASVLYLVVTPMINPLIYSLRNQEGSRRNNDNNGPVAAADAKRPKPALQSQRQASGEQSCVPAAGTVGKADVVPLPGRAVKEALKGNRAVPAACASSEVMSRGLAADAESESKEESDLSEPEEPLEGAYMTMGEWSQSEDEEENSGKSADRPSL